MKYDIKRIYDFLTKLYRNNNREWFNNHKDEYLQVNLIFKNFVQDLIIEVSKFDNDIDPNKLSVADCTYRIYRDIRFSADKSPYKTHMGVFIVKGGKKSSYGGYYFHIEPFSDQYSDGNMVACGAYMPSPKQIASFRDEASVNGDSFLNAISLAKGFDLFEEYSLKRNPRGFEFVENPDWQRLIRLKQYLLSKSVSKEYVLSDNLICRLSLDFKKCYDFVQLVNRCIDYAQEENTH